MKTVWGFTFERRVKRLDNVNVPGPLEVGVALSYGEDFVSNCQWLRSSHVLFSECEYSASTVMGHLILDKDAEDR